MAVARSIQLGRPPVYSTDRVADLTDAVGVADGLTYARGKAFADTVGVGDTASFVPSAAALFVGDYETNNFSQWPIVQNINHNDPGSQYTTQTYPARTVTTPAPAQGTYCARYEVRSGDVPFSNTERSEAQGDTTSGGTEGQTRWYSFSTMFDTVFPNNHASLGWGLVNQWHSDQSTGSPPVSIWVADRNDYVSLFIQKQSSPGVYIENYSIWETPLNRMNWHNFKMQICWSTSDATGFVRLWYNGVRQTFIGNAAGTQTHNVRTIIPGGSSAYYKEGYYRQAMSPTGIVYHDGFRSATTEAGV